MKQLQNSFSLEENALHLPNSNLTSNYATKYFQGHLNIGTTCLAYTGLPPLFSKHDNLASISKVMETS